MLFVVYLVKKKTVSKNQIIPLMWRRYAANHEFLNDNKTRLFLWRI